jgi:outer membrane receptor for ferrienterochelin and colicins
LQLRRLRRALAIWLCLWCFLSVCFEPPAFAQQPNIDLSGLSIEDLAKVQVESVYGASKFLQKASDAPASVTVVTGEEIQKYGYRTLADLLKTVRGFYVINDRNYSYVGVRGLSLPGDYNARILFLLNGHRVNDNIFDGAYVGTEFPVDIDLIDRVEIIRGPNSSVYGTGAFAAVINVITKRGRDLQAGEVSTEAESWNSYKGRVTYGDRFDNGWETLLSGSYYNSEGHEQLFFPEFNSPATNNGIAVDADRDEAYNIYADIIHGDFDINVVQVSRTKHIPTASFETVFNDPRTRTTDARGYVDFQYHHTFGSWETLGRASYDWYDYHGIYVYDYAGTKIPPFTQNYDAANGSWADFQGDASRTFLKRHKVTFGTEVRQDFQQQQINYDIQPYQLYFDSHRSSRVWALYFQDEYSIRKNLTFVAGLRNDRYNSSGNTISPRLGLLFAPRPSTDIKAIYSWAFRAPNDYEAFYAGNNTNIPNPSLRPERIRTWELDLDHRFGGRYQFSAVGFLNHINDLIVENIVGPADLTVDTNSGPVETKGIEWEFGAQWAGGVEGTLSQSLQSSRNLVTGNVLTNSPKQLGKMNISIPIVGQKLFASVNGQYVSERRTIAQTDLGGYLLMNLALFSRNLTDKFDISADLYNVFDKRYAESGGVEHVQTSIPQDGRSFRLKLTYRANLRAK